MQTLGLFTGYSAQELSADLKMKEKVLRYMVQQKIDHIDDVGKIISEYYINYEALMKAVNSSKPYFTKEKESKT